MAIQPFPLHASDLVARLDEEFPAACIKVDEAIEHHLRYAGKRELIEELILRLQASERASRKD